MGRRLGWLNILNLTRPDCHYELDIAQSDDREVGRLLFRQAVRTKGRNIQDLVVLGEGYEIKEENDKLYGVIVEKVTGKDTRICFQYVTTREQVEMRAVITLQRWWRTKHQGRSNRAGWQGPV